MGGLTGLFGISSKATATKCRMSGHFCSQPIGCSNAHRRGKGDYGTCLLDPLQFVQVAENIHFMQIPNTIYMLKTQRDSHVGLILGQLLNRSGRGELVRNEIQPRETRTPNVDDHTGHLYPQPPLDRWPSVPFVTWTQSALTFRCGEYVHPSNKQKMRLMHVGMGYIIPNSQLLLTLRLL